MRKITKLVASPHLCLAGLCLLAVAVLACSSCKGVSKGGARMYRTGEQAQVGQLVFTVLDAEWKSQIDDTAAPKYPTHRFLVVRLTVTNSGATEATIPHLALQDTKGKTYPEFAEAGGVGDWLGVLRKIRPVETQQGSIVFDVPISAYQLRVTDDFENAEEKYALVEIPLRIEAEAPATPITPVPGPQEK
jgi:hypothetical protein